MDDERYEKIDSLLEEAREAADDETAIGKIGDARQLLRILLTDH